MSILLIGGPSSQTSTTIATHLASAGTPYLYVSRSGTHPSPSTTLSNGSVLAFNYFEASTYDNVFPVGHEIKAVWSFVPKHPQPEKVEELATGFIKFAAGEGVERFVFIAGGNDALGKPGFGMSWKYLAESGLGWSVVVPSFFMDNFMHANWHLGSIRAEDRIYSATGTGKAPYISVKDIAELAFRALTDPEAHNCAYRLLGPALLSINNVATILSSVLGREVQHVQTSVEERTKQYVENGTPAASAGFLAQLEGLVASGMLEKPIPVQEGYGDVKQALGRELEGFEEFAERNRAVWEGK